MESNEEIYERLGSQIWSWRMGRGMTQKQLAEACGVSRSRISLIETGQSKINFETFLLIAKALDVEPYRLLDPKEKNNLVRIDADPEMQEILDEMEELCKQAGMDWKLKNDF